MRPTSVRSNVWHSWTGQSHVELNGPIIALASESAIPQVGIAMNQELSQWSLSIGHCIRCYKEEVNRDREETREVIVQPVPKNSAVFAQWAGVKTIGVIHRTRLINGKLEEATETFISSLPCKVRDITRRIREHWSIENQQHYILDVTFTEDASRIRKGAGPEISSVFRRLALNILQQDTTIKDSIRGKRKRLGWDNSALAKIITGFSRV